MNKDYHLSREAVQNINVIRGSTIAPAPENAVGAARRVLAEARELAVTASRLADLLIGSAPESPHGVQDSAGSGVLSDLRADAYETQAVLREGSGALLRIYDAFGVTQGKTLG